MGELDAMPIVWESECQIQDFTGTTVLGNNNIQSTAEVKVFGGNL